MPWQSSSEWAPWARSRETGGGFRRNGTSVLVTLGVCAVVGILGLSGVAVLGDDEPDAPERAGPTLPPTDRVDRAFTESSWWNTPLPDRTPLHPAGAEILRYLRTAPSSGRGCLMLAGAGGSHWGTPVYFANGSDPSYDVGGVSYVRPSELDTLRIPSTALPARNKDGEMIIYDLEKGYVVALTNAAYDTESKNWTASGATVTYLDSNGLNVKTGRSDDPRNIGSHRGNNGATMVVRWDEVQVGEMRHVLKVAVGPEAADRYIFPMVGSDGTYEGDDPAVPPQGLRARVKASINLDNLDLSDETLVIARALQRYGAYIGDSGGSTALKLENTMAEGRGQLWTVAADALCGLPFTPDYWDIVAEQHN